MRMSCFLSGTDGMSFVAIMLRTNRFVKISLFGAETRFLLRAAF